MPGVTSPGPGFPLAAPRLLLAEHPVREHRGAGPAHPPPARHRPHGARHGPGPGARAHRGQRGHRPRAGLRQPRAPGEIILVTRGLISSRDIRLLGYGAVGAGSSHRPLHTHELSQLQRTTHYIIMK